ncbi:orotidine-5'-phosphate decarboxylase [Candidatus Woesearchaeota archaeon]|nr:orotidine-5'-phosphate decarboxylase [Candidatus Woesearchaeota archaeon]
MNYLDKLRKSAKETGSIACMGLDPVVEAMPEKYARNGIKSVPFFLKDVFTEMKEQNVLPGAFKPNQGFYLKHDRPLEESYEGTKALARVINTLKEYFPDIPIILDYKRGDIDKSSANYAAEGFEAWEADAVTVHSYMGFDSVLPFAGRVPKNLEQPAKYCNDEQGKGVYVLDRTTNSGAKDFQDLRTIIIDSEGLYETMGKAIETAESYQGKPKDLAREVIEANSMPLYAAVAFKIIEWAKDNPGVGAVVGATSPEELSNLARLLAVHYIPLLIPGVGGQGGDAKEVTTRLRDAGYDLSLVRISSSSGITHPWAKKKEAVPEDYAKVCVAKLAELNEQINKAA